MFNLRSLHKTRYIHPAPTEPVDRGAANFVLAGSDLVEFARCPRRWALGQPELPARGYSLTELVGGLLLKEPAALSGLLRVPDTYQAEVLVCPGCESESASLRCTWCRCDRKRQKVEKPWAAKAKPCEAWLADCEHRGILPIKGADWDLATAIVESLRADADVAALLADSDIGMSVSGCYRHETGEQEVPLCARIDVPPSSGHSLDNAIGLLYVVSDSALGRHERATHHTYWHMQAALTLALLPDADEADRREVLQIVVETEPPHVVSRRRLDPTMLTQGRTMLIETLDALLTCRQTGLYPTFDPSAPGTLHGWTPIKHDPTLQEDSEKADARFGISTLAGSLQSAAAERAGAAVGAPLGRASAASSSAPGGMSVATSVIACYSGEGWQDRQASAIFVSMKMARCIII